MLKFLILASVSLFLIMILNDRLLEKCHIVVYMMIQLFIFVLPFWITEVPFKLLDKSWCGTVKAVDIKEQIGTYTALNLRSYPYTKHSIILTVETENGETIKVKAKEYGIRRGRRDFAVLSEKDIQQHMNDYREGDTVYHFYGLTELFVIRKKPSTNVNCVICGSQNPIESCKCYHCGHTLLHTLLENSPSSDQGAAS